MTVLKRVILLLLYIKHILVVFSRDMPFLLFPNLIGNLLCNKCQVTQSMGKFSSPKELFWEQCYEVVNGKNENNFVFVRSNWTLFPTHHSVV